MVYKNQGRVVPISGDVLDQILECLVLAKQELQGAGHEGWVCTTGVEQEITAAVDSLLSLRARLSVVSDRTLENEKQ